MFDKLSDALNEHIDYLTDTTETITSFFDSIKGLIRDRVHR